MISLYEEVFYSRHRHATATSDIQVVMGSTDIKIYCRLQHIMLFLKYILLV